MQVAELTGQHLGTTRTAYQASDAILYNLAVGTTSDRLDLVYERDLLVIPTYACALGLWAVEAAGDLGAYERNRSLHVGQTLRVHEPLPASGEIVMDGRVTAVWDKGKAALVEVQVTAPQFTAIYTLFLPRKGGWGGERGPSSEPSAVWEPAAVASFSSPANLAAVYRLTGDLHPIHVDPDVAAANGFDRPILHGLCTLGIAARETAESLERSPADVRLAVARFVAPVNPGDTIDVEHSRLHDERVHMRARVGTTVAIENGVVGF